MKPVQRRTLQEICIRYELEPSLLDVYVEGSLDADVLKWFFERAGLSDVVVYEIDTIDVPSELVVQRGLAVGMRGRVIALAQILAASLRDDAKQATCIADLDLDLLLGGHVGSPHLFYTDFSCMEMYLFDVEAIGKFLRLVASGAPHSAAELAEHVSAILREAALVRAAKQSLGWDLPWLSLERFCRRREERIEFDAGTMITRTLLASGKGARELEFSEALEEMRDRAPDDTRLIGNGHDLVVVLTWYLQRFAGTGGVNSRFLHRALVACLEFSTLQEQRLFATLTERMSRVAQPMA